MPGVIDAVIAHEAGEEINPSDRGLLKQICCRVLGHSDTVDEMRDVVNKVTSIYQVLDINGESLFLPILNIDKYRETVV